MAMANNPEKIECHKKAFMKDETVEDKSPESFVNWMVDNINPGVTFTISNFQLVFKILPPYGEEVVTSKKSDIVEF